MSDAASLIAVRRALLSRLGRYQAWAVVEKQIVERLRACFAAHPPSLRRIDLHTPPAILEQIVKYEAVHAIRGDADLRRRLQDDRRCYALFSAALPGQPLIFIEMAFTRGICGDVSSLLDTESPVVEPKSCDCGTFYSISSCDEGLRGIPFGNALIRAVVEQLRHETPWVGTFATVSPVPGFRTWLEEVARRRGGVLLEAFDALSERAWMEDPALSRRLEALLMPACAAYLVSAKRGDEPLDPVARFHLGNGARLERINWLGDRSPAGLQRSAGIVANYVYDLPSVDSNQHAYRTAHRIATATALTELAQRAA